MKSSTPDRTDAVKELEERLLKKWKAEHPSTPPPEKKPAPTTPIPKKKK